MNRNRTGTGTGGNRRLNWNRITGIWADYGSSFRRTGTADFEPEPAVFESWPPLPTVDALIDYYTLT